MKKHETLEIPREAWADYLCALSNREQAHPVRIRIEGRDVGDQVLANCLPLVGISMEQKGSEASAIEVTVAHEDQRNLTHLIRTPERVYAEEGDDGQVRPGCAPRWTARCRGPLPAPPPAATARFEPASGPRPQPPGPGSGFR